MNIRGENITSHVTFKATTRHSLVTAQSVCCVFQDVTNLLPEWEDGNFYLAKYYDKVMPMVTDNKLEKQGNLIRYIVTYFGK